MRTFQGWSGGITFLEEIASCAVNTLASIAGDRPK